MPSTFIKIRDVICDCLDTQPEIVTMESSFRGTLGADSLEILDIISSLEVSFGVELPNDDAQKILTVKDTVECIERALATKATQ